MEFLDLRVKIRYLLKLRSSIVNVVVQIEKRHSHGENDALKFINYFDLSLNQLFALPSQIV